MKIIKTANGKAQIKLSKSEWLDLGKQAGCIKEAQPKDPYFRDDLKPGEQERLMIDQPEQPNKRDEYAQLAYENKPTFDQDKNHPAYEGGFGKMQSDYGLSDAELEVAKQLISKDQDVAGAYSSYTAGWDYGNVDSNKEKKRYEAVAERAKAEKASLLSQLPPESAAKIEKAVDEMGDEFVSSIGYNAPYFEELNTYRKNARDI